MQKKADIYHKDGTPPLARRKTRRERPPTSEVEDLGQRRIANPRFAKTPNERIPFDGLHPDGPLPHRRRRRSKRKSSKAEGKSGIYISIGLVSILLVYGVLWGAFELYSKKKKASSSTANVPSEAAEQVAKAPPATVNVYQLIQDIRRTKGLMDGASHLSSREDYQGAIKQLNIALESLPNHVEANMLLARNYYMAKEYDRAIETLHHLLSENPDKLAARLLLGQALGKSGRLTEAVEVANWALEKDPYLTEAHILAAMSFKANNATENSIFHLRKAFNMKPDDAFVGNELALAYAETGNLNRSLEVFDSLMSKSHVDSVTYFNLATCYAKHNMAEEVVSTLLEAGERFGKNYIDSWVRNEKFDPVRNDPDFAEAFSGKAGSPSVSFPTSS